MKSSKNRLRMCLAALIDLSAVWLLMIIFDRILLHWWYVPSWILFCVLFYLYNVACLLIAGQTAGASIMGYAVLKKNDTKLQIIDVIVRELIKTILMVCLPIMIWIYTREFYQVTGFWYPLRNLFAYLIILFVFFCIGKMPWDLVCKTKRNKATATKYGMLKSATVYVALCLITCCVLLIYNNKGNHNTSSCLGFKFPFRLIEYPDNKNVTIYKDYLSQPLPDAKNYVLSLFDKYDIVVLEEGTHDAIPQWDLIYDIVSDNRFITKAGTVFTEYGSSLFREDLNTVLQTQYSDDSLLIRDLVASVNMRPRGYCFLNYLVKLNHLNSTLPDSLKIKNMGVNYEDAKYISMVNYRDSAILHGMDLKKNDSCMAQTVIDWYEQTHRKCLIVTNTVHAYAIKKNCQNTVEYLDSNNFIRNRQTQRIYNQYPSKMANIFFYHLHHFSPPTRNGIWGAAFKANQYKSVGFDLNETPFGSDKFDYLFIRPQLIKNRELKYQDIFHGIVFYAPENTFIFQDTVPYIRYAIEQEFLRYVKEGKADSNTLFTLQLFQQTANNTSPSETVKEIISGHSPDNPYFGKSFQNWIRNNEITAFVVIAIWNFIDVLIAIVLIILSTLIILPQCLITALKR